VRGGDLRDCHTESCGCLRRQKFSSKTHGLSLSAEFRAWGTIQGHCLGPTDKVFKDYGGRGITVCEQWLGSFDSSGDRGTAHGFFQHRLERWTNAQKHAEGDPYSTEGAVRAFDWKLNNSKGAGPGVKDRFKNSKTVDEAVTALNNR
jgi:hypothetical protein